ncbi:MAG: ABC transporter permease [Spirochaetia bacterium]
MNRVLVAIFRKEMIQIFRDPQSLVIVLVMPLLMLFLYGYAISLDMKRIDIAIIDESHTPESRSLVAHVTAADFFHVAARDIPAASIAELFNARAARCVLVIPEDYASRLAAGLDPQVQLVIDASDPNVAGFITSYVGEVAAQAGTPPAGAGPGVTASPALETGPAPFSVSPRIFYNPEMRSTVFYVPGLIALILGLITTVLTSIAIVRERETGTMEQILVSPASPRQIILGKILPYTLIAFIDGLLILVVGSLWFNVPVKGSFLLVNLMMLIYIGAGLSLGALISTRVKSQADAFMRAQAVTNLPTMMLSGFVFPVSSMPRVFQLVSAAVPATYFMQIIRGIILKGNTIVDVLPQAVILLGMDILLVALSVRSFRVRLE